MSRPIPKCAFCGVKLTYKDRVLIRVSLPGRPEIGWHFYCAKKDDIFQNIMNNSAGFGDVDERKVKIAKIEERGAGRVVKLLKRKVAHSEEYYYG